MSGSSSNPYAPSTPTPTAGDSATESDAIALNASNEATIAFRSLMLGLFAAATYSVANMALRGLAKSDGGPGWDMWVAGTKALPTFLIAVTLLSIRRLRGLIILDEAPVYNANHLFGFFSVFNGDALKSVELIKGGFAARYGGRLSSVIDLQMKDGNKEKIHGEAGIGIISSRLTLEGPIIKNKCSFLVSARRTYIDALIYPFLPKDGKLGYYFYDMNAKINYVLNDKDRLYLSGYFGKDKFYLNTIADNSETKAGLNWGNATGTLRWNHLFSSRLFSNLSLIFTNYQLGIESNQKYGSD